MYGERVALQDDRVERRIAGAFRVSARGQLSLPADVRPGVEKALAEASTYFNDIAKQENDDALEAIAEEALKRNVGARGLKIIIEELMLEIMYMIPSQDSISECVITREVVENRSQPITLYRKAG